MNGIIDVSISSTSWKLHVPPCFALDRDTHRNVASYSVGHSHPNSTNNNFIPTSKQFLKVGVFCIFFPSFLIRVFFPIKPDFSSMTKAMLTFDSLLSHYDDGFVYENVN
ncbi:hypothetical protein J1N35_046063 [Gossypium stocksii]|uniref:Uncharacterized protein n=1 Tax=Gossypium stocksii TaxID=47602 RepID=A0A9D3ZEA1_9ROSI|nr:hypothetical protein J1N35_046063 [Gossypium stocksii]